MVQFSPATSTFLMEDFEQTNMFAWICTIFAHLIIGCVIRYPKLAIYAKFMLSTVNYFIITPRVRNNRGGGECPTQYTEANTLC